MAIINRVLNCATTVEHLNELHVNCPYNDITASHWGYCDVMEATVRHTAKDWHGYYFNSVQYNVIVERFVDEEGNEIAKSVQTVGKAEYDAKEIKDVPVYTYMGYLRTITYIYTNGSAIPSVTKTADVSFIKSGQTLTYTVDLQNDKAVTSAWKSVFVTDMKVVFPCKETRITI